MSIKSRISFEKVYRLNKFNQNAWIKPYIGMSTDLKKKKATKDFEKDFVKFHEKCSFWKK